MHFELVLLELELCVAAATTTAAATAICIASQILAGSNYVLM